MLRVSVPRQFARPSRTLPKKEGLFADTSARSLTARVGPEHRVQPGSTITLAVDARRMHFFEPATGEVLGNDRAAPSEP